MEAEGFQSGGASDKFVPNPSKTDLLHLQMFEFVGKLMGVSLRTKAASPFALPSLVWKRVLGADVTRRDLYVIDSTRCELLDQIAATAGNPALTDEYCDMLYATYYASYGGGGGGGGGDAEDEGAEGPPFTTISADGRVVQLARGGKRTLTRANAAEFAAVVYDYHLSEFNRQCSAIAAGLATQIPIEPLRLFTSTELELLVVGKQDIDLKLLKSMTTYVHPYTQRSQPIKLFWKMMEEFTMEERSLMINFTWSRHRIPLKKEDFPCKFKIEHAQSACVPDQDLPRAHTCFFQLDLPAYTTYEACRERCLYAITECAEIDMDGRAGDLGLFSEDPAAGLSLTLHRPDRVREDYEHEDYEDDDDEDDDGNDTEDEDESE
jgi:hypothetical protein